MTVSDSEDRYLVERSVHVVPLPPIGRTRILVWGATPQDRYHAARHFPASRTAAKVVRAVSQAYAVFGPGVASWPNVLTRARVWDWVDGAVRVAVLMDASRRGRLILIAEVEGGRGICAKVADKPCEPALSREAMMLSSAPKGLCPQLLRYEPDIESCSAIVTAFVSGRWARRTVAPHFAAAQALKATACRETYAVQEHPWVRSLLAADASGTASGFVERLQNFRFPTVVAHGDFAPWNVIETVDGGFCLVDWESGCVQGFPFVDEAHWVLQVTGLVRRHSARRCIREFLRVTEHWEVAGCALPPSQRLAVLGLTALYDDLRSADDSMRLANLRAEVIARCG